LRAELFTAAMSCLGAAWGIVCGQSAERDLGGGGVGFGVFGGFVGGWGVGGWCVWCVFRVGG